MVEIREFITPNGHSPYAKWFDRLEAYAAAKVTVSLARMEKGNLSNAKSVGAGVLNTGSTMGQAIGSISAGMATL